jgi:hypothetical protein
MKLDTLLLLLRAIVTNLTTLVTTPAVVFDRFLAIFGLAAENACPAL